MNGGLSQIARVLASVQPSVTYTAWRITENSATRGSDLIDVDGCQTLDEAAEKALLSCQHKEHFLIVEQDAGLGTHIARLFQVKRRSRPNYVRVPGMAHTIPNYPEYHVEVCAFAATMIGLKPPFDAFRDSASGVDHTLVEQG